MRTFAQKPKAPQQATPAKPTIHGRAHVGHSQEVNSLLHLQRTLGNQALQRMLQTHAEEPEARSTAAASPRFAHDFSRIPVHRSSVPRGLQPTLRVNTPGDIYEQEADCVAEQVIHMPDAELGVAPPVSRLQRVSLDLDIDPLDCDEEEARRAAIEMGEGPRANGKSVESSAQGAPSPLPRELGVPSPGESLPAAVRAEFAPRFGWDLASVRIHAGPDAARSALSLNARAYTAGSHVVFGKDQYSPGSHAGRALLAHELTHVVQQAGPPRSRGRAGAGVAVQRDKLPTIPRTPVRDRITELKTQKTSALGGGDIPVLEILEALQRAVAAPRSKPAEITKAVDAFLKAVDAHPLEAATQSLIGNVGDDIATKLVAKGLTDEADRILAHFHSTASSYELTNLRGTSTSYIAIGSGYFPDASKLEGGFKDRLGNPLHTLQDFQAGTAPFVSVAMDADNGPPLGTRLSIDEFPGVVFRVVDTGGAFAGKGLTRIDICTANKKASLDRTINGPLHLRFAIPLPYHEPLPVT